MQNINLHYSGGSGGFIALHLLLLTNQYFCSFAEFVDDSNFLENLNFIIESQWSVTDISKWKNNEYWPNNQKTMEYDSKRCKIFFHCNEFISIYPGKSLLIYTDLKSQNALNKIKNSNWYINNAYTPRLIWQKIYHDIKSKDWNSTVDLTTKFETLPDYQQMEVTKEILKHSNTVSNTNINLTSAALEESVLSNYKVLENGIKVIPEVHKFYKTADYSVKLQDLINSNGKALLNLFGIEHSENHSKLIEKWKKIHPWDLLETIGINL
jgi:hypothetical protein